MGNSGYQFIGAVIAVAIAAFVFQDAKKRGMNSWGWAIGTFLLCIVFLPLYLIMRKPVLTGVPGYPPLPPGYPQQPGQYPPQVGQYPPPIYPPQAPPPAPTADTRYCAQCGKPHDGPVKFCPYCGAPQPQ